MEPQRVQITRQQKGYKDYCGVRMLSLAFTTLG
ncbi:uncharacterized protein METZ01_LOCUS160295 [marine metagenome]|uniref:Uncharacterized protein n=1 Tax=marine metagenome TaxID=408172 RepID=A0A382B1Q4_9ZZZZ